MKVFMQMIEEPPVPEYINRQSEVQGRAITHYIERRKSVTAQEYK